MPYGDLLRALEEEVRGQCRALEEEARREADRIADEGRRLSAAAREEALAGAAAEREALQERARVQARSMASRAILEEERRVLAEVRSAAAGRLAGRSTPGLTCALLAEALGDDDGSPVTVTCDPGHAAAAREWIARHRPDVASRTTVVEGPALGGVLLRIGDGFVVDDTLPSRLARAWPALEVELGRLLFEEGHG
jgi:V/A-type H+-transporting ATPase subunit E